MLTLFDWILNRKASPFDLFSVVCGSCYLLTITLDCAAIKQHKLKGDAEVIKKTSTLAISFPHAGEASDTAVRSMRLLNLTVEYGE